MQVFIDQDLNVTVLLENMNSLGNTIVNNEAVVITEGDTSSVVSDEVTGGEMTGGEMTGAMGVDMNGNIIGATSKDPILASWPFVIGITSGTLIISIIFGILLAKRKIKKGFELYED